MQRIVIDAPYEFIPPRNGTLWPRVLLRLLPGYLRRVYGVEGVECRGAERLAESIAAGHGILLAGNHCRDQDPLVIGHLCRCVGKCFYLMASWHLFMQSKGLRWILPRAGAFSIYREGMDRQAINMATEILEKAERPLVLFPEGVVSRTNDRLNALMDGVALIARTAAKRRAKQTPAGKVVVHPVGVRYHYTGDVERAAGRVLDRIEGRLSWRAQKELGLRERIAKVGVALLSLKEIEYLGAAQEGRIGERLERLIDHLLEPLEREWVGGEKEGTTVGRVKRLRAAILPDLVKGEIGEAERERRWRQLADAYLAQQLSMYPPDYLSENPTGDRLLETVERLDEDLNDRAEVQGGVRATVSVGEAIEVKAARETKEGEDALMGRIEAGLRRELGLEEGR